VWARYKFCRSTRLGNKAAYLTGPDKTEGSPNVASAAAVAVAAISTIAVAAISTLARFIKQTFMLAGRKRIVALTILICVGLTGWQSCDS
jgi:hypothetical protein